MMGLVVGSGPKLGMAASVNQDLARRVSVCLLMQQRDLEWREGLF